MSEIGNISKSFGKQINISVANTFSDNILNSTSLPSNTIIISSPIDDKGNDIGTYCLLATDVNGTPVRLSYTIQPGNGLNVDITNPDILKLDIDQYALELNNSDELQVDLTDIIDNDTLVVENDRITVNTQNLPIADGTTSGVIAINNSSTKISDSGNLYVDVDELDKANETTVGVVTSDNDTIYIDSEGIVSVNTENLQNTSYNKYGVVKLDNSTVQTYLDNIYVVTDNLNHCSSSYYGIVKPDNNTVNVTDGQLYVNTQNLRYATNENYGVTKVDGVSLIVNNGVLSMNNYDKLINDISNAVNQLDVIEATIDKLNKKIS